MGRDEINADVLAFNFSGLARRWSREWMEATAGLSEIAALGVMKPKDDLPEEEAQRILLEVHVAISRAPELMARRDKLLAQVLVNVPRKWLHEDAPDNLDWNDPLSLDWVLEEKFPEIISSIANRRSKN